MKEGGKYFCPWCRGYAWGVVGCMQPLLHLPDGWKRERVRYGHEPHYAEQASMLPVECEDCGTKLEEYHHVGCLSEVCPECSSELPSCSCGWDLYHGCNE